MKIKVISTILALLLLIPALASCSGKPEEITDQGYLASNEIVDYFFYYPEEWVMNVSNGMLSVYAVKELSVQTDATNPEDGQAVGVYLRPNVSVTAFNLRAAEYPSVQNYWDMVQAQLEATFTSFELLSQTETKIADYDAFEFVYIAELSGVTYKYEQTIFFAKAMAYTVTFTSTPDAFDEFLSDVVHVKSTFAFK